MRKPLGTATLELLGQRAIDKNDDAFGDRGDLA